MIIEKWRQNKARIKQAGHVARTKAHAAGLPVYYTDTSLADGIIRELPDGTQHLIEIIDGEDVVKATLPVRRTLRELAE